MDASIVIACKKGPYFSATPSRRSKLKSDNLIIQMNRSTPLPCVGAGLDNLGHYAEWYCINGLTRRAPRHTRGHDQHLFRWRPRGQHSAYRVLHLHLVSRSVCLFSLFPIVDRTSNDQPIRTWIFTESWLSANGFAVLLALWGLMHKEVW